MANPFDQFDTQETQQANPFDQFDAPEPQKPKSRPISEQIRALNADMGLSIPEESTEEEFRAILGDLSGKAEARSRKLARNAAFWEKPLMALNAAQRFGNSATLGAPDFVLSKAQQATGLGENIRDVKADLKEQFPKSSTAADIGGTVYGLGKAYDAGKTFTKFVPKGLAGKKKVAATTAALAADGAVIGGVSAGFDERDISEGAKWGAISGGGSNLAFEVGGKVFRPLMQKVGKSPTIGRLKHLKNEAYKRLDDVGVTYAGEATDGLRKGIIDDLANPNVGLDKAIHPATSRLVRDIEAAKGNLSFQKLEALRKRAARIASNPNGGEDAFAASIVRTNIDEFIQSAPPRRKGLWIVRGG